MPQTVKKKDRKMEKEPKKLAEFKQTTQLMLPFQFVDEKDRKYSNTIELYDAVPKYFWGKSKRVQGKFLNSIVRQFKFRGVEYEVELLPARIKTEGGGEKDYFPGKREELVEDALRKFASDGSTRGVFLDNEAGVVFSLYELQDELKRSGHHYSYEQLKTALYILRRSSLVIKVRGVDGESVFDSSPFKEIGMREWEAARKDGKRTKIFVQFNRLVTNSIKNKTFRQYNYNRCMGYKFNLARWLEKRMSHIYLQASVLDPYTIRVSTIFRDSSMSADMEMRNKIKALEKVLKEMMEKEVVERYEIKRIKGARNKILDAKVNIFPHLTFRNKN